MPEVRGGLNVAVPAVVSNALLRKISADWSHRPPRGATDSRERLMRRLLECPFQAELGANGCARRWSALAELAPGDLLTFSRRRGRTRVVADRGTGDVSRAARPLWSEPRRPGARGAWQIKRREPTESPAPESKEKSK